MKELSLLKCMRCEGEWVPKVENPRQCPLCKSPLWNTHYRRGPKKPPVSVPKSEHYIKDTEKEKALDDLEPIIQKAVEEMGKELARQTEETFSCITKDEPEPLSYAEQVKLAIERMRK